MTLQHTLTTSRCDFSLTEPSSTSWLALVRDQPQAGSDSTGWVLNVIPSCI